ncbi:MAG TPA: O-antigen ligase family protein, partial [Thermoleophilaceae bacterium]|nr:O-antigen ligase family protein [Thermoleophilaceae bacterium]
TAARMVGAESRDPERLGTLRHARRLPGVAFAAAAACVVGLVIGGLVESAGTGENVGAEPSRFVAVSSLRYEYWRVGAEAFFERPLLGEGSGAFRVLWRQERDVEAGAVEVHSLVIEMATELGLPGLVLLGLFLGGVAACGRTALRAGAPLAPGACAVCAAWLLHASIDWDWQMPAVTLPALVLAGGLLAEADRVSAT